MSELVDTIVSGLNEAGVETKVNTKGAVIAHECYVAIEEREYGALIITLESPKEREEGSPRSYKVQNVAEVKPTLDAVLERRGKFNKKKVKSTSTGSAIRTQTAQPTTTQPVAETEEKEETIEPKEWSGDENSDLVAQMLDIKFKTPVVPTNRVKEIIAKELKEAERRIYESLGI